MVFHRLFAPRVGIDFSGCPSMAHQEFKHDSDINAIVSKFLRTGEIHFPNADRPLVDGFDSPGDFTEAANAAYEQQHLQQLEQQPEQQSEQQPEQQSEQQPEEVK